MKNDILATIVANKQREVAALKQAVPERVLQQYPFYRRAGYSLKDRLASGQTNGIIAEFKRRSPSKGWINAAAAIDQVTLAYEQQGVAGISILTDQVFFGGHSTDLLLQREQLRIPLLRKDFMISAYQVTEAKAIGADVILLIAACLTPQEVRTLSHYAHDLGLEVLLEIHSETELDHISDAVDMVGINNRNLKTFEVDIETSIRLLQSLPADKPAIAESGISDVTVFKSLQAAGFQGFLMGEHFMKQPDPGAAIGQFVHSLNTES